jgi:hypothetical protein
MEPGDYEKAGATQLVEGSVDGEPMKRVLAGVALCGVLGPAPSAWAVEDRTDVESDHIDATDDGGPRAIGFLLHPLFMATGWVGAEVDAACGERVLLSVEGDARWLFGTHGLRAVVGAALFPQRFAFHGLYVHPTFEWDRSAAGGASASALGGGITVGYAWTWSVGATVRLGGGIAYARGVTSDGTVSLAFEGLRPAIDADAGWVF